MINLISLTKLIVLFSIIYFFIVMGLIWLFPKIGISNLSDTRLSLSVATFFEFFLLYLFSVGWRKIWRVCPYLNEWIFPDLNGTWNAEIAWNWKDETGKKQGVVYIKQSLIKISIDLNTDESESSTLMVKPFKDLESGQPSFYYMYRSESISTNNKKYDYKGAAILKLNFDDKNKMSGNYFTDRKTFGRYTFTKNTTDSTTQK